jgi:cytochrome c biogenesis protein CcmG/thiol:disulfide interchange protein DsbE
MTELLESPLVGEEDVGARRPRTLRWVALALAVVLVLFVGLLATREPARNRLAGSPLLGKPAPEVTGTALDGTTVRLSQFRGRYVLLNFFATWCVPCRREHPELVAFSQRHQAAGDAQVLAVIWDDDPAAVRRFFETRGGDWPVIEDPRGKVALDFGARGPPETFLIDPDGFVLFRRVGEVNAAFLEDLLARAKASQG